MKIEDISKILAESYFKKIGGIPSTSEDDDVYIPSVGEREVTKQYIYRYKSDSKEVRKIYKDYLKSFTRKEQTEIFSLFQNKVSSELQYRSFLQKFSGMNDKIFPLFIFYLYLKDSTFWNKGNGKVKEKVLSALGFDSENPYNKWKFLDAETVNFFRGLTLVDGVPLFSYKASPADVELAGPEISTDYNNEYRSSEVNLSSSAFEVDNLLNQNPNLSYDELQPKVKKHISPQHFDLIKKKVRRQLFLKNSDSTKEGFKNVDGKANTSI